MKLTAHLAAGVVLWFAALLSMLGWMAETCTGNAPDSLMMGVFVIPLNLLGVGLLALRPHIVGATFVALVPLLASFAYVGKAVQLLAGASACSLITGDASWERMGEEAFFGGTWLMAALVLWGGIALTLVRGYRALNHD